jgi:hypothetical protein
MTPAELAVVVEAHGKWRRGEPGGIRAYLAGAYLAGANLAGAYLAGAYLARANLAGADLADAYLARANLAGANLAGANLAGADLADAYLARANLADAYLARANLADAYLARANLAGAYLADAYLARANLADAYLADAYLAGANLAGAYLADAYLARAKGISYDKLREQLGIEFDPELPRKIVAQVEAHPETWDQGAWHSTCGTKHCIAGWAVQLTPQGRYIEKQLGTANAATLLLWRDGVEMPSFDGHATSEQTIGRLKAFPAVVSP